MRRGKSISQPETLNEFLNNNTVPIIKKLAGLVASNLPTRKAELIKVIEQKMNDPKILQELWKQLDTLQQSAVSEVLYSPSLSFDADGFQAKYGTEPNWGVLRDYGDGKPSLLRLFIYGHQMPRDLAKFLKSFVPAPKAIQVQTSEELPTTVKLSWKEYDYSARTSKTVTEEIPLIRLETERPAQQDIHAVLRLIDAGKVRASEKTKRVTAAGAKAITQVLQGGDFYPLEEEPDEWRTEPGAMKAFAWPLILQNAGFANLAGSKLQLTPKGKNALNSPPHKSIRTVWNRWLKSTLLDELNRVNAIKGQTGKGKRGLTAVSGRRATIVTALKECPPNQWIAFDAFSRFMRAAGHRFVVTRNAWSLYIAEQHYGSLGYDGYGGWNILQERYMMAFLFEYAATMGLLDVAYIHPSGTRNDYGELWGTDDLDCLSRYDGLLYIRINNLGAWCLGLAEEYVPSPIDESQIIKVLPNRDVVAMEPLPPGDILFLEQFTEQTSDLVWKIQPAKLLKMLEEGHSIADVEMFLTAKSGGGLPDNVAVFFKDMTDRASLLTDLGPARLIEAKDSALAQLIVNDSSLRSLCMLAGERHIVVPADSESTFRRALRKLGYVLPLS